VLERASLAPEPAPTVETGVIEGTVVGADPITSAASGATFGLRRSVTPVTGATVTAEEAGRVAEATTTADGAYQFEALKPGEYEVTVMAVGFISVTRPVTVEANKTVTENFELDPRTRRVRGDDRRCRHSGRRGRTGRRECDRREHR